ncbi:MAG TPA: hypothetical protein DCQ76_02040 [Ruminococcaceae bacterium]|nr:hypothetical protein [Oscillospiraceae bacterium]
MSIEFYTRTVAVCVFAAQKGSERYRYDESLIFGGYLGYGESNAALQNIYFNCVNAERSYISLCVSFCFDYLVICYPGFGKNLGNRLVCRIQKYSFGYGLAVPRNDGAHTAGKCENKHGNAHNEHGKREKGSFCIVFLFHFFTCLPAFILRRKGSTR